MVGNSTGDIYILSKLLNCLSQKKLKHKFWFSSFQTLKDSSIDLNILHKEIVPKNMKLNSIYNFTKKLLNKVVVLIKIEFSDEIFIVNGLYVYQVIYQNSLLHNSLICLLFCCYVLIFL